MIMKQNELDTLNGSTKNGTVRKGVFFAAMKKRLYLCSAFETQMHNIEY